ncbi:hypothetical protein DPMN_084739 [Dreissena polymorpha]|uniref:Uncharacterized protein n=1 Tax=Dreissena polymorpha TaxID=45954 RepID=A0A9D3YF40_DREPO|nr:hypothetical protein DPMN_084739 [Dreissena polymorpha]
MNNLQPGATLRSNELTNGDVTSIVRYGNRQYQDVSLRENERAFSHDLKDARRTPQLRRNLSSEAELSRPLDRLTVFRTLLSPSHDDVGF